MEPLFWVFISYSHADERSAGRLFRWLERYRVPKKLVGTASPGRDVVRPAHLRPIYRDREEFSAAHSLSEHILSALRNSRTLVVICSPRSAASRWVNEEIAFFQSLGRGDRIFCLLVDGEPNSVDPALQCMPPALASPDAPAVDMLAADARPGRDPFRNAALRLVAGIIDARFDDLRQRDQERRIRVLGMITAASAALLAVVGCLAVLAWQQRNLAVKETDIAEQQRHLAEDRRIAAEAATASAMAAERAAKEQQAQAVAARNEAQRRQLEAVASNRRSVALRLAAEAPALVSGLHDGGDERALLETVAMTTLTSLTPEIEATHLLLMQAMPATLRLVWEGSTVNTVDFSPDGKRVVSGGDNGTLHLRDAQTLQLVGAPIKAHQGRVSRAVFSPDGASVASGGWDGTVRLWDARTGRAIGSPLAAQKWVNSVAFSPDGLRLVAGGSDGTLRLWDAHSGQQLGASPATKADSDVKGSVECVAFSPDGERLYSTANDVLSVWDSRSLQRLDSPSWPRGVSIVGIAFSHDGTRMVSTGRDQVLRLWDARTAKPIGEPLTGAFGVRCNSAFSPHDTLTLSGEFDGTMQLLDAKSGEPAGKPIRGHKGGVYSVAISPVGQRLLSGGLDGTLRLWDAGVAQDQSIGTPLAFEVVDVDTVLFSPDDKKVLSIGRGIDIWDRHTGQPVVKVDEETAGYATAAALSADGSRLLTGDTEGVLRVWDARTLKLIGEPIQASTEQLAGVAFSPDRKRMAATGIDGQTRVWDARTAQSIGSPLSSGKGWGEALAFSPDGRRLVVGKSDGTLWWWDAHTGAALAGPVMAHEGRATTSAGVNSIAFSRDGSRLLSGGTNETLRLWDAHTLRPVGAPFVGHKSLVTSVAISPDGRRLLSASTEGPLFLWDAETGKLIGAPLLGHDDWVDSVAYSPDGRQLLSAGHDGTVRLWPAPPMWREILCSKLTRNMSRAEWKAWISPDIDYEVQCPGLPISP
jgi:WD40 repeat protein